MKFRLLLSFAIISFNAYGQGRFADAAFVYKGFNAVGTTAGMRLYSKAVDTLQSVTKSQLDAASLDTLNFLLSRVKAKRHFQQKLGRGIYASVIKDGNARRIVIFPDWAIIDVAQQKQYVFRGTPYAGIFHRFVERNFY